MTAEKAEFILNLLMSMRHGTEEDLTYKTLTLHAIQMDIAIDMLWDEVQADENLHH